MQLGRRETPCGGRGIREVSEESGKEVVASRPLILHIEGGNAIERRF